MIFVLLFVLFYGYVIFARTHKKGVLKNKKNVYKPCLHLNSGFFYASRANFLNYECKTLLNKHSRSFAKKVDVVLSKVRLLSPQTTLSNSDLNLRRQKIGNKPVFVLKQGHGEKQAEAVEIAQSYEDFFAISFLPSVNASPNSSIKTAPKTDKAFFNLCQKLNVNLPLNNLQTYFFKNVFNLGPQFKKQKILTTNYLLTKYTSQNVNFFVYNFFVGEPLCLCFCKNKTNAQQKFEFNFFYDLANKSLNYYEVSLKNNFAVAKNILNQKIKYLNFSLSPSSHCFSGVVGAKKSNLPCFDFYYDITLEQNQKKQLAFMLSNSPKPLGFISFSQACAASSKQLENFFCFNLLFDSAQQTEFFAKQIVPKAKAILLEFAFKQFYGVKGDFDALKQKYLNKEIDALCFYISVKSQLFKFEKTGVKINPYFLSQNCKIQFLHFKNPVEVRNKKLPNPCLVLDGVRYFNHLFIDYALLNTSNIKIEC